MTNDNSTNPELAMTEEDKADLAKLLSGETEAPFNPILRIYREIIGNVHLESVRRVTIPWANRMLGLYHGLTYADMPALAAAYFDRWGQVEAILDAVIESDDQCLDVTTPEEDLEHNAHHYKTLLLEWQKALVLWEMNWDPAAPTAAVEVAANGELYNQLFGEVGIIRFLDNIKFPEVFTDDDRELMRVELEEFRALCDAANAKGEK